MGFTIPVPAHGPPQKLTPEALEHTDVSVSFEPLTQLQVQLGDAIQPREALSRMHQLLSITSGADSRMDARRRRWTSDAQELM